MVHTLAQYTPYGQLKKTPGFALIFVAFALRQ
jgi:hypothetical protein